MKDLPLHMKIKIFVMAIFLSARRHVIVNPYLIPVGDWQMRHKIP
jgi:hypothetical protein